MAVVAATAALQKGAGKGANLHEWQQQKNLFEAMVNVF
jgi:hypothetical protein